MAIGAGACKPCYSAAAATRNGLSLISSMSTPPQALVTGAAGFIGRHLVRRLLERGQAVKILVRSTGDQSWLPERGALEIHVGDILAPASLEGLGRGIDHVFHLAAEGHVSAQSAEAFRRFQSVNVEGTENVMRATRTAKKFIHFSSTAAMGLIEKPLVDERDEPQPCTPYQKSKLESEHRAFALARELGLSTMVLRPCMVYGVGGHGEFEKMARLMRRGLFPRVGRGRNLTPLVHVRDVVEGALLAAEHGRAGEVYLLTSARSPELAELHRWILAAWGTWAPYPYIPRSVMLGLAWIFERYARARRTTPIATRRNIVNTVYDREFSIEKARHDLGYEPQVSFEAGIRETIAWYRDQRP